MLAVLMSMKPEWWEKILDGEKTLEIRKTHPQNERLEWPVTVLVYVSGTGAVQGQFLCPGEVSYRTMQDLEEMSCVPREDLLKYAKGRRLSGWIVQSPEKFDAPSPLAEFALAVLRIEIGLTNWAMGGFILAAALIGAAFRTARERRRKERAAKYVPVVLESAINVQRSLLRDITASEDQSQINTWRKSVVKMTLAALNEKRERMIKNGAEK